MNKLKYFLSQNIHMIWREIEEGKKANQNLLVQLGKGDVPIVMQYGLEMEWKSNYKTSVLIQINWFTSINEFKVWIEAISE